MATNIYESHYSGYFVGRESLLATSMQVAMVMASQFVTILYVGLPFQYYMILAHGQVGESIIN